jgi:hypothetical protein
VPLLCGLGPRLWPCGRGRARGSYRGMEWGRHERWQERGGWCSEKCRREQRQAHSTRHGACLVSCLESGDAGEWVRRIASAWWLCADLPAMADSSAHYVAQMGFGTVELRHKPLQRAMEDTAPALLRCGECEGLHWEAPSANASHNRTGRRSTGEPQALQCGKS